MIDSLILFYNTMADPRIFLGMIMTLAAYLIVSLYYENKNLKKELKLYKLFIDYKNNLVDRESAK